MKNVVIAEYLTNMVDSQYTIVHKEINIAEIAQKVIDSVRRFNVETDILINFQNEQKLPPLVKAVYCPRFARYPQAKLMFGKWEIVYEYLLKNSDIDKVALVDLDNVEMLNYPFADIEDNILYIGDEFNDLNNSVITSKQDQPDYLIDFNNRNKYLQLLNSGVLAGTRETLLEFLGIFIKLYTDDTVQKYLDQGNIRFAGFEVALVNYIAYNYFNNRLCHGRKVTTKFMYNDTAVKSWFKFK
ncbi:hypothetical protein PT285_09735 [Lactobacillus sp. ESL0791]|uniref:hypothetical protein n=1 Tax=Lactobacillus sp. ESL0791 TaxID=2983234 RepID=UPI0023F6DB77|nr:hypothetical protein [Lactobacillus sp. ESL0791]MDF7639680.1 hypothetical protein [Lactobacillus sp. ESL0791]